MIIKDKSKKEIINRIIGGEAKNRGFNCDSLRKGQLTHYLAIFSRKTKGKAQRFDIFEDLIHKGKISLVCMGQRMDLQYRDELSFETAIKKFAEYMNTIGYKIMDDALNVKDFQRGDIELFSDNYQRYGDIFFLENSVDANADSKDFYNCIKKNMEILFDRDFDEIKDILMKIAGGIVCFFISNDNVTWTEKKTLETEVGDEIVEIN